MPRTPLSAPPAGDIQAHLINLGLKSLRPNSLEGGILRLSRSAVRCAPSPKLATALGIVRRWGVLAAQNVVLGMLKAWDLEKAFSPNF